MVESVLHEELEAADLSGRLIVAMPGFHDPHFYHAVAYICSHTEDGAIGLIVNRPTNMDLNDIFDQMDIKAEHMSIARNRIYSGGPVQQERGFVLHPPSKSWKSSIQISEEICITTSRDILHAIAHGDGPDDMLVTLGYAGWNTGQLEKEFLDNAWLSVPCDPQLLFSTPPEKRWAASLETLGFNAEKLSVQCGHA